MMIGSDLIAKSFYQKLVTTRQQNDSLLCVGLDPEPFTYPEFFQDGYGQAALVAWGQRLIEQTADLVCCYKPNIAFYEQFGAVGWAALKETIALVPNDIPVLLDCKRGDIGPTAVAYARAVFEDLGADAVTLNPYLGQDSIDPFLAYADKAIFVLCYNSNPSAALFQEFPTVTNPLYLQVVRVAQTWGISERVGFVVGATQPIPLSKVRRAAPNSLILAPGVGVQGGDLAKVLAAGLNDTGGGLIVAVSRAILYSADPRQTTRALLSEIKRLQAQLAQQNLTLTTSHTL